MQSQESPSKRCAVCRGRGLRMNGNPCVGCEGRGTIPAKKVVRRDPYAVSRRYFIQWKRVSGLVY